MRGDEIEECGIGVEKPAQAEKHKVCFAAMGAILRTQAFQDLGRVSELSRCKSNTGQFYCL